jgi:hypothetical protein
VRVWNSLPLFIPMLPSPTSPPRPMRLLPLPPSPMRPHPATRLPLSPTRLPPSPLMRTLLCLLRPPGLTFHHLLSLLYPTFLSLRQFLSFSQPPAFLPHTVVLSFLITVFSLHISHLQQPRSSFPPNLPITQHSCAFPVPETGMTCCVSSGRRSRSPCPYCSPRTSISSRIRFRQALHQGLLPGSFRTSETATSRHRQAYGPALAPFLPLLRLHGAPASTNLGIPPHQLPSIAEQRLSRTEHCRKQRLNGVRSEYCGKVGSVHECRFQLKE